MLRKRAGKGYNLCMDFSYFFSAAKLNVASLLSAGFSAQGDGIFAARRSVSNGDFFALITLDSQNGALSVQLFDTETGEKFALFDFADSAFASSLREEVRAIMAEIRAQCFLEDGTRERFFSFLKSRFGAEPDFPWADTPDFAVFRCKNGKWFALVMKIKCANLGLSGDGEIDVVNLKADSAEIKSIVDSKRIFPAWHMNKKHWISALLSPSLDFSEICRLTERSFALVSARK